MKCKVILTNGRKNVIINSVPGEIKKINQVVWKMRKFVFIVLVGLMLLSAVSASG